MNIIKLNAIESTNTYIKELAKVSTLENYTVVVAENQTSGRGQMGATWEVESGKSLTFSVLLRSEVLTVETQFFFNMCVSMACQKVIDRMTERKIQVKWPNDIMAEKDKIAGVLIENVLHGNTIKASIVGIGVNVNQLHFPKNLTRITSLAKLEAKEFDKEQLLKDILMQLSEEMKVFEQKEFARIKAAYKKELYQFEKPRMFEDVSGETFLGKITDVNASGKLVITDTNEKTREFGIKEIKFASF